MIYSIPVSEGHFRSIKDPNNENIRIAHALVNVNDLPFDLPLDPDPRAPKEKGAVPQQPVAFPEQYVHLEILERIEEHLADIAEARNFSVALKSWTLANYRDKFEWLLQSLGPEYAKHIKVRENDEQPVGILDVIQIMSAVNPILFS